MKPKSARPLRRPLRPAPSSSPPSTTTPSSSTTTSKQHRKFKGATIIREAEREKNRWTEPIIKTLDEHFDKTASTAKIIALEAAMQREMSMLPWPADSESKVLKEQYDWRPRQRVVIFVAYRKWLAMPICHEWILSTSYSARCQHAR
jgi:hypothetical protein